MIITVNDDLSSTIISDDELRECLLPAYNPETMAPFVCADEVRAYAASIAGRPEFFSPRVTPEQRAAERAAAIANEIGRVVQMRLDDFARTRGYDSVLSACTYATSAVPQFQAEGQCCVDVRDQTWATLVGIMAEVQAGTRELPGSIADVEADLPALEWSAPAP